MGPGHGSQGINKAVSGACEFLGTTCRRRGPRTAEIQGARQWHFRPARTNGTGGSLHALLGLNSDFGAPRTLAGDHGKHAVQQLFSLVDLQVDLQCVGRQSKFGRVTEVHRVLGSGEERFDAVFRGRPTK